MSKRTIRGNFINKQTIDPIYLPLDALRITVLHNGIIAAEYDMLTKQWLRREEALNKYRWGVTLREYRIRRGYEILPQQHSYKKTHVIADLHLGHANIIKYCARPFQYSKIDEMDRVLINNWNSLVHKNDRVYFLGDLCLCNAHKTQQYLEQLNGDIRFIRGNHDQYIHNSVDRIELCYEGEKFLLTHDPRQVKEYDGWIIHGHLHNNNLKEYGLINHNSRTINVSAEVVDYKPVELDALVRAVRVAGFDNKKKGN